MAADPFRALDPIVGTLWRRRPKRFNPDVFASGYLGGDPHSVRVLREMGLDGVSVSPWLVPVSTLAAAQANLARPRKPSVDGRHQQKAET